MIPAEYPVRSAERTRWILARRGPKNPVTAAEPQALFIEEERTADGRRLKVATIFLTNRECPWKCAMCDLWRNTTDQPVPPGAIARQIRHALEHLPRADVLKLYNSGSFFDAGAIRRSEWSEIAALARGFERVIVECHPRLVGGPVVQFASLLSGELEVAMGLETCHPEALEALNKKFSLEDYRRAADFLGREAIGIRTFLLVRPPFIPEPRQEEWLERSQRCALDAGSAVVSLIPLRRGNGALEALSVREPTLDELEAAHDQGLRMDRGAARIFADTWDLERFSRCDRCLGSRAARLARMNLTQQLEPRVACCCAD